MAPAEYYDYKNHRPINLDKDGCELSDWSQFCEEAPFTRHPKGFPIFLKPDKIDKSDEYKESDPYTVELNLQSGFHQRRLDCTLTMITEALNQVQGVPSLLDLGCGQGHITARIKEHSPTWKYLHLIIPSQLLSMQWTTFLESILQWEMLMNLPTRKIILILWCKGPQLFGQI